MPDFETDVVHAGVSPEPVTGAVMTPIFQSSTFQQISPGKHKGYEYTRTGNPTRTVLETQLAALERGDKALCFSSGTSAEDAVLNMLDSGDHVVTCDDLYGGTRRLFTRVAAHRGIRFTFVDARDLNEVEAAFEHKTKIVWVESPTNPLQNVFDIRKIADLAASHGAISLVDNTFLSPYFQRPLELGADIALHSMTKYLNGHSDVVMGAVIVSKTPRAKIAPDDRGDSLYTKLKFLQNAVGAVPSPFDCFLALRGIKTLALRMSRHQENALQVAEFLSKHPRVEHVFYPGLPTDPGHLAAKRQQHGFGGTLSFRIKGGMEQALAFFAALRIFTLAESLGGVESLIEHPAIMTHSSLPPEIRQQIGIGDNLIRASVGIESARDLIADLDQALTKMPA